VLAYNEWFRFGVKGVVGERGVREAGTLGFGEHVGELAPISGCVSVQDVMKRKAMEIDKSKIEARGGGGRMGPSMSISSSGMGSSGALGGRGNNGMDVDSGPSFARYGFDTNSNHKYPFLLGTPC
jgi:hypothetical protein